VALLAIGIAYNAIGEPLDLSTLRLTGVLQLIGIAGAVASATILLTRRRNGSDRFLAIAGVALLLLIAYGAVLLQPANSCQPFSADCSPFYAMDQTIVGRAHLYRPDVPITYDPEGLAVSVAAAALVLAGYLAARSTSALGKRRAAVLLAAFGSAGVAAALTVDGWIPISKRLFTPTFALLAASLGALLFAAVVTIFDFELRGSLKSAVATARRGLAWPFIVLGRNALVVFLTERVLIETALHTTIENKPTGTWLLSQIGSTPSAALVLSTALLLTVFAITATLHWKRRYLVL